MLNRLSSWLLVASITATPALLLTTSSGGSAAFYLAILLCLAVLASAGQCPDLRDYRKLCLAACAPLAVALLSSTLHAGWSNASLERGLRLALGLPLLLAAMQAVGPQRLKHALWGVLAAGWAGTATLLALVRGDLAQRPLTDEYNAVGYGNLLLLFAVITLLSLGWRLTRHARLETAIKLLTLAVTFAGFVLTQTRSGWLAMPVFVALALLVFARIRRPLRLLAAVIGALAVLVALGSLSPSLRDRVEQGLEQYHECKTAPTGDTSICIRLQLWRAAWGMMLDNPVKGVGPSGFAPSLRELAAHGKVSPYVAEGFGEPHNDILEALALYGIPGGVALLLLYAVPALLFMRRLGRDLPQAVRAAAAMGVAVCLGFALFGLTELMFRGMRTVGFYAMLVALFAVLSDPTRHSAQKSQA
ncbi:O-antigen ligase family protein [Bordetella hinzii]|uniref:O-antigen ligase domain-containing protein n=1 Tax=Bordetella hinzii TaxID=103855 RepID=A0AAN1VF70_9BORD|nr:O-antigen ligase family protein [Bordetella hinzii]AKQ53500.1 O-Antigen ligase [Bordetella hinzii]AKQ58061.1 O-Antigen ligase [Bordetella hinzii]AZW16586.1 O-antigen ligase domain-containing protein [Bordetella hinzii]KCB29422.1 O-antigen ligase [Bordetella hinzii L60]KCB46313.1 O-antigen ligase [Bordetella hinzii 4161]